ncbi:DNA gyrase subunit B [Yokenella regensburgei]|uniref:DNA gyrase subunit B n=1 Tax=Yokenella regensburgei TaxID=158877 RepID=UPI003ED86A87
MSTAISQLLETYMLKSDAGSCVKYEVYIGVEDLVAQLTVYRFEPNFGIEKYDFLKLAFSVDVLPEIQKHFEENYK